jgi:hypothetical protein
VHGRHRIDPEPRRQPARHLSHLGHLPRDDGVRELGQFGVVGEVEGEERARLVDGHHVVHDHVFEPGAFAVGDGGVAEVAHHRLDVRLGLGVREPRVDPAVA